MERTIRVTGKGKLSVKSDMIRLRINIEGTYEEYDKIDFKISVLKKVSRVLETSVTYLTEENAVNIEDEIMQMAMVLQQIKSRELRKAAIAQVKVLAEII